MKTVHVTLKLEVPDNVNDERVEEIVTLDLKRAMRIFGVVKGISTEVLPETVKPPLKRVRGRRVV